MIAELHQTYPDLSIRRLCDLFAVSRSWYSTHPSPEEVAAREVALRDAIEQLVLTFPGYGYRRVTKQLQSDGRAAHADRGMLQHPFLPPTDWYDSSHQPIGGVTLVSEHL